MIITIKQIHSNKSKTKLKYPFFSTDKKTLFNRPQDKYSGRHWFLVSTYVPILNSKRGDSDDTTRYPFTDADPTTPPEPDSCQTARPQDSPSPRQNQTGRPAVSPRQTIHAYNRHINIYNEAPFNPKHNQAQCLSKPSRQGKSKPSF